MIFWDTSAVVPLLVSEPSSAVMLRVLRDQPDVIVWWGTLVECQSALCRREREGALGAEQADQARARLHQLQAAWSEVLPVSAVRTHAGLLLRRHPLRAADALQLAAALVASEGHPEGLRVLTLDERLAQAARGEGFPLVFAAGTMPA